MKPKQMGLEILAVENGWVVFDHRRDFSHPACEVPKYVFVDPFALAVGIRNLLVYGTIDIPEDKDATELSH